MTDYWEGGQARVVARLGTHILGDPRLTTPPCNVPTTIGDDRRMAAIPLSVDGATKSGFDIYEFEYNHPEMHNNTVAQGEPVLSGGCPAVYDGRHCSELGFHYYPYATNDATPVAGGNLTDLTTYQWCFVYEWIDAYGVRHRSAPSVPIEVTLTPTGHQSVTIDIATLQLTEHQDPENKGWPVRIVAYRTRSNGSTFYEMPASFHEENDPNSMYVTFLDTNADAALDGRPTLYTSGSPPVLPNLQPPAAKHIIQHNRRLWLISRDDPTLIWISKIIQPGSDLAADMPGWPTEFVLRHEEGGGFTALASFGAALVAFKEDGIYLVSGEPGDDTNQGANLGEPNTISLYAGCVNPRSVVHTPEGLLFQSRDTFWLLDRGFQVKKVGMPVEDLLSTYDRCTSAVVDPGNRVVLVTMVDGSGAFNDSPVRGVTLAWHYDSGEWTYWHFPFNNAADMEAEDLHKYAPAMGACMANRDISANRYHQLQADGTVFYLDRSKDFDNSTPVLKVSTPWLQFNGLTGFQRVNRVQSRSTRRGSNNVLVRFSYNHEEEPFAATRSLYFDGSGYLDFGNVHNFDYTDDFSVVVWVKTTDSGTQCLLGNWASASPGWGVYMAASKVHLILAGATTAADVSYDTSINDGEWHQVVFVWEADGTGSALNASVYIDGVQRTATVVTDTLTETIINADPLVAGIASDLTFYEFTGNMCQLGIWSSALKAVEVAGLYNMGRPLTVDGTGSSSWWPLGEDVVYPNTLDAVGSFDGIMVNMGPEDIVLDVPSGPNCVLYSYSESASVAEQHYETHVPAGYQKSKAMRVILETQDNANAPANPRLENLIFTAGGKKGRFKLPDDNRG